MKLEFQKLTVRNFGSFIKEQSFSFNELDLGAYFIRGVNKLNPRISPNGSGKSTFFVNALCWVLTGRMPRGLRSTDIKPWGLEKGARNSKTVVELLFSVDGKEHSLIRIAPNSIRLDGNEVGQEHIDQLTRLPFPILKQTVVFGQHESLFFDLMNREKLAVLSEVLNLDRWEIRAQKASERVQQLSTEQAKVAVTLAGLELRVESIDRQIKEAETASKKWKAEQADRLKQYKERIKELSLEEKQVTKQRDKAISLAKSVAEKLGEQEGELQVLTDRLRNADKERARMGERARLLERQVKEVEAELAEMGSVENCPTCGQPLKGTSLGKHIKELQSKKQKLEKEIEDLNLPKYHKAVETIKEKFILVRSTLASRQSVVAEKQREANHCTQLLIEIGANKKKLTEQIAERKEEKNPHLQRLKSLKAEREQVLDQIEEFKVRNDKLGKRIERTKFWVKGFKDVRLFIIDEVLQELELTTNAVLADLGMPDWRVEYDIERETKSGTLQTGLIINIMSPMNKEPVRWECWSGGESQRLRLAGSMALSEVLLNYAGVDIDLEIFDEPTKHMNTRGVEDFYDLLSDRARDLKRRIFIVDHTVNESSAFEDTIVVVNDVGGSYIEE